MKHNWFIRVCWCLPLRTWLPFAHLFLFMCCCIWTDENTSWIYGNYCKVSSLLVCIAWWTYFPDLVKLSKCLFHFHGMSSGFSLRREMFPLFASRPNLQSSSCLNRHPEKDSHPLFFGSTAAVCIVTSAQSLCQSRNSESVGRRREGIKKQRLPGQQIRFN